MMKMYTRENPMKRDEKSINKKKEICTDQIVFFARSWKTIHSTVSHLIHPIAGELPFMHLSFLFVFGMFDERHRYRTRQTHPIEKLSTEEKEKEREKKLIKKMKKNTTKCLPSFEIHSKENYFSFNQSTH